MSVEIFTGDIVIGPRRAGVRLAGGGGVSYDAAALTLFAAMSVQPDAARKQLISDTIAQLKAAGIWSLLDEMWMLAAHDSQAGLLGWKRYRDCTAVNAPTFTTDRGYAGNGTTSYLNTQFIPGTHGLQYTLNDASLGTYNRTNNAANVDDIAGHGATVANMVEVAAKAVDGNFYAGVNQSTYTGRASVANADSRGLYVGRRTGSTAHQAYKNGVEVATSTRVSTALTPVALYIGAANNNGTSINFSTRQYAFAFIGASMTADQQLSLFTIVEAYLDAIGAGVV